MKRMRNSLIVGGAVLATAGGSVAVGAAASSTGGTSIDPADFGGKIDNPYLPWKPGTVFRYRGHTEDGHEDNIVTVTHRKREILGVHCVVVHDVVRLEGQPEERTADWYAQDKHGNVWYFGERSFDYKHGQWVRNKGSWRGGVHGAKPGIVMLAHPKKGDHYRQEVARHARDRARVAGDGGTVTVPYGTFRHTLAIKERTPLEPDILEEKLYARGIGVIKELTLEGGSDVSRLVSVTP
jgi:hypothetical protein